MNHEQRKQRKSLHNCMVCYAPAQDGGGQQQQQISKSGQCAGCWWLLLVQVCGGLVGKLKLKMMPALALGCLLWPLPRTLCACPASPSVSMHQK